MVVPNSVTRFGEILQLWQNCKSVWAIFGMAYLVFGKLLHQLWHFYAKLQIFIVVNGQRLNSNIAICSHWYVRRAIKELPSFVA